MKKIDLSTLKETEKAVQVILGIEDFMRDTYGEYYAWIPKSQMKEGKPSMWILEQKAKDLKMTMGLRVDHVIVIFKDGSKWDTRN